MSQIRRRQFLQAASSTLAVLGLSQLEIRHQAQHYNRALAQSTPRKLALLVGINNYPGDIPNLRGCLTDIEMQYELLVHRYGFNPRDIVIVSDQDLNLTTATSIYPPTRQAILEAFEEHLIQQARTSDVVVFHYSGHGSRVVDARPVESFVFDTVTGERVGYNGTLVPIDGRSRDGKQVDDIMGKTLFLLTSALKTDQVTLVLDSCHSEGGIRGDLVYRALDGVGLEPSQTELAYQESWRAKLGWSEDELQWLRSQGIAKGVALGSARFSQAAADAYFGGFYAGAFTYSLTHYLWQQSSRESVDATFANLARRTRDVAQSNKLEQDPIHEVAPGHNHGSQPIYFVNSPIPSAEAVVRRETGGEIEFWLGGVSSQSLEAFQAGAIFNLIDGQGRELGQVEQTRRRGLVGYGRLHGGTRSLISTGLLLRERVRGVPANPALRIGLDSSLGRDLANARSHLTRLDRIEPVPVDQSSNPHYLLGRMTEAALNQARLRHLPTSELGIGGTIGLFTTGLTPIEGSFGRSASESIDAAIDRLRPRLKMLLAGRILRAVLNSDTSDLNVDVVVTTVGTRDPLARSASRSAEETGIVATSVGNDLKQLRPETEIQIRVTNNERQSLYVGILVIGSSGRITVLHPIDWNDPEAAALITSGQSVTVPKRTVPLEPNRDYCANPDDDFHFCVTGVGFFEVLVLASTAPLRDALKGLQDIANELEVRSGDPIGLGERGIDDDPVQFMDQLLGDLDRTTRADVTVRRGVQAIDTHKLAALSVILEVVE